MNHRNSRLINVGQSHFRGGGKDLICVQKNGVPPLWINVYVYVNIIHTNFDVLDNFLSRPADSEGII